MTRHEAILAARFDAFDRRAPTARKSDCDHASPVMTVLTTIYCIAIEQATSRYVQRNSESSRAWREGFVDHHAD